MKLPSDLTGYLLSLFIPFNILIKIIYCLSDTFNICFITVLVIMISLILQTMFVLPYGMPCNLVLKGGHIVYDSRYRGKCYVPSAMPWVWGLFSSSQGLKFVVALVTGVEIYCYEHYRLSVLLVISWFHLPGQCSDFSLCFSLGRVFILQLSSCFP